MASPTKTPQADLRELYAHVLILCHYVEDWYVVFQHSGPGNHNLADGSVLVDKAKLVKQLIMDKYQ